jgi:membrane fusion protein, copper/silver efflux system
MMTMHGMQMLRAWMRRGVLVLLVVVAACGVSACTGGETGGEAAQGEKVQYTCPMHPSVLSDAPGACPVCHMDLVRKSEQTEMSAEEAAALHRVKLSPSQRVMANVETDGAMQATFTREVAVVGVVDFAEPLEATVSARFRGRIETMHVNFTGAVVRKGQPLFDLYSADVLTAQQDYLIAMRALTRAQETGNASVEEMQQSLVDGVRTRLRVHYGITTAQITELERRGAVQPVVTYHAPMAGTVVRKQAVPGQYVDEGTPVLQIADLSRVWCYLDVSEQDLRAVRIGQPVVLTTDAWPGETFAGRVTFIDPVMNGATRTVRVRAELANAGGRLKPQMYVKGVLTAASVEALAVPASAVIMTGTRAVVWVEVAKNEFEARTVQTGVRTGDRIEILSGLGEGDMVVVSGGYLLDSESALQHPAAHAAGPAQEPAAETASAASGEAEERTPQKKGEVRTIRITVDMGYMPERITLKKGERVRLVFNRVEDSRCTDEVVFPDFDIRKKLPAFKATAIELTPTKTGTFTYSCGMDMLHGTIVVR